MSPTPPRNPPRNLSTVRRKAVGAETESWIRGEPLLAGRTLPFVLRPTVDGLDLAEWAAKSRARVDELLAAHRALLFRGFRAGDLDGFRRFVDATSDGGLLEYRDRTTPRETRGERMYTSTIHPADQRIHLHNEGTYWLRWAAKLYFFCRRAAATGGETPIADVRRVYERIAPAVRRRFEERGMMLVRNFNQGFGLPWQDVFQTQDRAEVEEYCRTNRIEMEWGTGDRLQTRQVRPAVRRHHRTGELVWFNHAAFFHHTSLEPAVHAALLAEYGVAGLPYNTCYGDGTPIEPETATELRRAYEAEKVVFPWQEGDVLLLDNMTVAHAREPFTGEREVVVCMTDAVDGEPT